MSSTWNCTGAVPPAVPIKNAITAASNGCCARPTWRKRSSGRPQHLRGPPLGKKSGGVCCFNSSTTSCRAPQSRRCLSRRKAAGARPGAAAANGVTGPWLASPQGPPRLGAASRATGGWGNYCRRRPPLPWWNGCCGCRRRRRATNGRGRSGRCPGSPAPAGASGCNCPWAAAWNYSG